MVEAPQKVIRQLMLDRGKVSPYDAYVELRQRGWVTSYGAVWKIFYALEQIGLIYRTGETEPSRGFFDKSYYALVEDRADDPRWGIHPLKELYPYTRLGRRRYRARKRATTLVLGRNPAYA